MSRLVAGSLILGLGGGGMLPVWSSLLAQVYGVLNYGRVMGLMAPVLLPFNLLTPPLAGWVRDISGSYDLAFMGFVLLLLLAVAMIPLIERSGSTSRRASAAEE
jgi:MFS family permease